MRYAVVALTIVGGLGACERTAPPGEATSPPPVSVARSSRVPATPPVEMQTDLARLRSRFEVPAGTVSARWVVQPLGDPGLGPTDYVLYAHLALETGAWSALEARLGAPRAAGSVSVPRPIATELLDAALVPPGGEAAVVTGSAYDVHTLARMPFRGDVGIRVADGLIVVLATM